MKHDGILKLKFLFHMDEFMFFENDKAILNLSILSRCPLELCSWLSSELADFMATIGAHFFDFYKLNLTRALSLVICKQRKGIKMTKTLEKEVNFDCYLIVFCPKENRKVLLRKCRIIPIEERLQRNRKYKQCPYFEGEDKNHIFCGF